MSNRPGHDRRYAIDPTGISSELGWRPRHSFEEGLAAKVHWNLKQQDWCQRVCKQGGYSEVRLGMLAGNTKRDPTPRNAAGNTRQNRNAVYNQQLVASRE